jgi:hypothetical protein
MSKTIRTIIIISIITLGAAFALSWYSNGFESFSPLYLTSGGIVVSADTISVMRSGATTFRICGAGFSQAAKAYSVKIIPSDVVDFEYIYNGDIYQFSAAGDLTAYYDYTIEGDTITLQGKSIQDVLAAKHGGEVTLPELDNNVSYLKIIISDGAHDKAFYISDVIEIEDIILDPDHIVFGSESDNNTVDTPISDEDVADEETESDVDFMATRAEYRHLILSAATSEDSTLIAEYLNAADDIYNNFTLSQRQEALIANTYSARQSLPDDSQRAQTILNSYSD